MISHNRSLNITKSDGKNSGETDHNKNQCEKTNRIVPKIVPEIHYEGKEVIMMRDKSIKPRTHLSETNKKWNKLKKRGSNFTKKSWEVKGKT